MDGKVTIGRKEYALNELRQIEHENVIYIGNDANQYLVLLKAKSQDIYACSIHEDTKIIYSEAFKDCKNLCTITIPENVETIYASAFDGCSGIKKLFYNSISVEYCANTEVFSQMGNEEEGLEVFIGPKVAVIPDRCENLREIHVEPSNQTYVIWDNILYNKRNKSAVYAKRNITGEVVLWNETKRIEYGAFMNCRELTSISIPPTVSYIGKNAFIYCPALKRVEITDIAAWCNIHFESYDDADVMRISMSFDNPVEYFSWNPANDICHANPLNRARNLYVNGVLQERLVIPEGVTNISEYAFKNCTCITELVIPNSLAHIGKSAFMGCTNIAYVDIRDLESWRKIVFENPDSNPIVRRGVLRLNGTNVDETNEYRRTPEDYKADAKLPGSDYNDAIKSYILGTSGKTSSNNTSDDDDDLF